MSESPAPSTQFVLVCKSDDRPGIVADVASAIRNAGGNIVHADQHLDRIDNRFASRHVIEFADDDGDTRLLDEFRRGAGLDGIDHQLTRHRTPIRTAILGSSRPHCPDDLLRRAHYQRIPLDVRGVISDRTDLAAVVEAHDTPFIHVPIDDGRDAHFEGISAAIDALDVDLVILARYMRVIPPWLVDRWFGRMINIHHSTLPAFVGATPYTDAWKRGVKVIGATAHYVTAELDEGPIIVQHTQGVTHRDSVEGLIATGEDIEIRTLAEAVAAHVDRRVIIAGNRTIVFEG